jgi:hypothetical protein
MDTGSTGVVVSADKIPSIDRLPSLGPGQLTYSSSGRVIDARQHHLEHIVPAAARIAAIWHRIGKSSAHPVGLKNYRGCSPGYATPLPVRGRGAVGVLGMSVPTSPSTRVSKRSSSLATGLARPP